MSAAPPPSGRWAVTALAVVVLAAPACAAAPAGEVTEGTGVPTTASADAGPPGSATSGTPPGTAPPATADATAPPEPAWSPTTTAPARSVSPVRSACGVPDPGAGPTAGPTSGPTAGLAPPPLPAPVATALAGLQAESDRLSVVVGTADGGELIAIDPDLALPPASNQKLLVAYAAYATLPLDDRLTTAVVATGPVRNGVVQGDLVLVGGGDPTLNRSGPHSLDTLAAATHAAGIAGLTGAVRVDETRYDGVRTAPGWSPAIWSSNIGPLSALVVDRNRGTGDPTFVTDPMPTFTEWFADALRRAGVAADRTAPAAPAGPGVAVAAEASPPIRDLLAAVLGRSDNLAAELLVKEVDRRNGGPGSTVGGLAAARRELARHCSAFGGIDGDGSGLSGTNAHSARDWRSLLVLASRQPWWPEMVAVLPTSGTAGTLYGRLSAPGVAGRVHAKTGSVLHARALSGVVQLPDGRNAFFSVVANGGSTELELSIDDFVAALATSG